MIDISEVGAGGGSIARVDDAGALRVGPRSASSVPARPALKIEREADAVKLADGVMRVVYFTPAVVLRITSWVFKT